MAYGALGAIFRYGPAVSSLPLLRHHLFPHLEGEGLPERVALTFDDGPDPTSTPLILAELDRLGVKATFFLLGSMAETYPYVASEIVRQGHEISLHGQWHRNHLLRSARTIAYDLERGLDAVSVATDRRPTYFRPPYGVAIRPTLTTAYRLNLRPVLWGAWGRDWRAQATPTTVLTDIKKRLKGGTTILLHDADCTSYPGSFRSTLGALAPLVELCEDNKFQLGPLRHHGF